MRIWGGVDAFFPLFHAKRFPLFEQLLLFTAGVPRSRETATPQDCTVGLCLGPYSDPRGVDVSYGRGAPVGAGRTKDLQASKTMLISHISSRQSDIAPWFEPPLHCNRGCRQKADAYPW